MLNKASVYGLMDGGLKCIVIRARESQKAPDIGKRVCIISFNELLAVSVAGKCVVKFLLKLLMKYL